MRGQRFRVRCADGFLSVPAPQKKLKKMSVLIVTSVYQAAAQAIVPGSDAHREASKARIPRSDKGSKLCAEAVEDASAATMLTNAWTGDRGHATHARETRWVRTEVSGLPGKQNHDSSPSSAEAVWHLCYFPSLFFWTVFISAFTGYDRLQDRLSPLHSIDRFLPRQRVRSNTAALFASALVSSVCLAGFSGCCCCWQHRRFRSRHQLRLHLQRERSFALGTCPAPLVGGRSRFAVLPFRSDTTISRELNL